MAQDVQAEGWGWKCWEETLRHPRSWEAGCRWLAVPPCSSLSVIGTWYVTAVIIIKYIWPDKELVPVEIPTRCVQEM